MDLEQTIVDKRSSPAETSLALLDFFQDFSNGGSSKEAKFLRLFSHLLERIFGPTMNAISQREGGDFISSDLDGIEASWLMKAHPWKRAPGSTYSSNSRSSNATSAFGNTPIPKAEMDPVVQLLTSPIWQQRGKSPSDKMSQHTTQLSFSQTQFSLFQLLEDSVSSSQLRNARFAFPFVELSPAIQRSVFSSLEGAIFGSSTDRDDENAKRLLELLVYPPLDQKELNSLLRPLVESELSIRLSPRVGSVSSPFTNSNLYGSSTGAFDINDITPSRELKASYQHIQTRFDQHSPTRCGIRLTTEQIQNKLSNARLVVTCWEYYMLLFLRYPAVFYTHQAWVKNRMKSSSASGFGATHSIYGHHGEKVYNQLCMNYIKWYFPHVYSTSPPSSDDVHKDHTSIELRRKRQEIFLRLAMEYWINLVCTTFPTTELALKEYQRTHGPNQDEIGLDTSYQLASLISLKPPYYRVGRPMVKPSHVESIGQTFSLPSKQAQKCIRMLVNHLVCDPQISRNCRRSGSKGTTGIVKETEKHISEGINVSVSGGTKSWPLPSAHTIIMPSLYNYIRTTFRHAPIYTSSSRGNFFTALNLWLTWLEPWNVVHRKKGSSSTAEFFNSVSDRVSESVRRKRKKDNSKTQFYAVNKETKPTSKSNFSSEWIPYVAANLHFYTVPLAIFLRRARELDFSKVEFQKSIILLQRVIRVFSSLPLLDALNNLLNYEVDDYLMGLVNEHERILASFCPPRHKSRRTRSTLWSLEILQKDVHIVLEEIVIQHQKTLGDRDFLERMETFLSNLFVAGTKDEEGIIKSIVENAKRIVRFPPGYTVLSQDGRSSVSFNNMEKDTTTYSSNVGPERGKDGFITERGRMQLMEGSRCCNPMDVVSLGDPMYARVKSYEIPFLVKGSLHLSEWLNMKFGFCDTKENTHDHFVLEPGDKKMIIKLAREGEACRNLNFRFNLRFLADCRNWVVFFLAFHLLKVVNAWMAFALICGIWKLVSSQT